MKKIFGFLIIYLFFFLIGSLFGYYFKDCQVGNNQISPSPTFAPTPTQVQRVNNNCVSLKKKDYLIDPEVENLSGDIDNDGEEETLVFYKKYFAETCVVIKSDFDSSLFLRVVSGKMNCLKEEFVTDFNQGLAPPGEFFNRVGELKFYRNFFSQGKNSFVIPLYQTACGSSARGKLFILSFEKNSYHLLPVKEISSDDYYQFVGEDYQGKKLVVASPVWEEGEAHFSDHFYELSYYVFNSNEMVYKKLEKTAKTRFKYSPDGKVLEEIFKKEPQLLSF